jgi:cobalt/nickel transport system permease protein
LIGLSKNSGFIGRSIMGALSFLKESAFSDEYASRDGLLQSIDPRIKLAGFTFFILTVLFTKSIAICLCLYVACIALAFLSNIDLGFFLKRTWIFIPLFSVFIAIPAAFSLFTPGEAIARCSIFGLGLTITRQGLFGAVLFVSRVAASVSFAVLLGLTTRHFVLLKALRIAGVPQIFVMVMGMCYRYIYLFIEVIENTYTAIMSRVGSRVSRAQGQRIVSWNMACLWYRSYRLNEAVYSAMISRGYAGEPVTMYGFSAGPSDWIWLFCVAFFCAASLYFGAGAGF